MTEPRELTRDEMFERYTVPAQNIVNQPGLERLNQFEHAQLIRDISAALRQRLEQAERELSRQLADSMVAYESLDKRRREAERERDEARAWTKTYTPDELDEIKSLQHQLQTAQATIQALRREVIELKCDADYEGRQYREFAQEIAPQGTPLPTEGSITFGKLKEVVEAAIKQANVLALAGEEGRQT